MGALLTVLLVIVAVLAAAKIKASALRTKQKSDLLKQLEDLKKELSEVRGVGRLWLGWAGAGEGGLWRLTCRM